MPKHILEIRPSHVREYLSTALWFIPATMLATAGILAEVALQADTRRSGLGVFSGDAATATSLLSSIASATLTLTAVVFSMTMVVLQLASSQYSPRAMRSFLRHRTTKFALGVFISTFGFAMLGLRTIRAGSDSVDPFIPSLTVTIAFALATISVLVLMVFIHHISQSIRVTNLISSIRAETEHAIDRCWTPGPEQTSFRPTTFAPAERAAYLPREVTAWRSGYVSRLDWEACAEAAKDSGSHIALEVQIGQFVYTGAILFRHAAIGSDDQLQQRKFAIIDIADERATTHDPRYGIRQLVDIADRALSPGINDPSTATHALDQILALMQIAGTRSVSCVVAPDHACYEHVSGPHRDWASLTHLAFDELRLSGGSSLQFASRLREGLDELLTNLDDARRRPILLQRELLQQTARDLINLDADRERVQAHNHYY